MAWLPALIVSLAVLCSRSQTPAPRTAIQGDLTSADWIDGTHPLINCTIYVSNKGSDSAAGTAASPLQTPEAAVLRRRVSGAGCPSVAIVLAATDTFYIKDPPLTLDDSRDSNTRWEGNDGVHSATLSAGWPVPPGCWALHDPAQPARWSCVLPAGLIHDNQPPRTIMGNGTRLTEARFPGFTPADPYGTSARAWLIVNSSAYIGNASFIIGVQAAALPRWATDPSWSGARVQIFPTRSWINIVQVSIAVAPPSAVPIPVPGLAYFRVQCPLPSQCTNTSNSATIGAGNRFFIDGAQAALTTSGSWAYNRTSRELAILTNGARPTAIVVPRSTAVLRIAAPPTPPAKCTMGPIVNGRSPGSAVATLPPMTVAKCLAACCGNLACLAIHRDTVYCYLLDRRYEGNFINGTGGIVADANWTLPPSPPRGLRGVVVSGVRFSDTDYRYNGYQEGFSLESTDLGMPRDAAVVVSNVSDITLLDCTFVELGGGGVHIANASSHITVNASYFSQLGQTGVTINGDTSTQPIHCTVADNTIAWVGTTLASAAGIVASTTSFSTFANNSVQWSSRWGIHLRSQGMSISYNNVVDGNTLSNLAMSTRDMGGLSFIGEGHTGTVVRNNCVRNVIGMDTDSTGHFLRPFYTWGLYLDNWSSNFTVTGNVIRGNVLGGVFVHGGSNNTISNNVLYNSSNASMPTEGHYPAGGLGVTFGYMHVSSGSSLENNHVTQNIIVGPASGPANPGGTHGPTQILLTIQPNFTKFASGLTAERNLYFQPGVRLESTVHLTPLGGWAAWRSSGYDTKSVIDVDPLFVGASTGDFRLARGSMALAMGFVPLDNPQC